MHWIATASHFVRNLPISDQIAGLSLLVSIGGFSLSFAGFLIAYFAFKRGNSNASAALAVTFSENFRAAWSRVLSTKTQVKRNYELADLMNLIEGATTLHSDGSFTNQSEKMITKYIRDILAIIEADTTEKAAVHAMIQADDTFEHTKEFCRRANIPLF